MSKRLPSLKAKDIIRALNKMGFCKIRQKGSHMFFKHPDGRFTLVPHRSNEDIGKGLLRQILREINISPKELAGML